MNRPLLCALLVSLLCAPARAGDDRDYLYGTEPPNNVQQLNRRLKLIEHALFDVAFLSYQNDMRMQTGFAGAPAVPGFTAEGRTGYFQDRRGTSDAVWAIWDQAQKAVTPQFPANATPDDVRRIRAGFHPDLTASARLAGELRGKIKPIAQFYLDSTSGGRGSPTSISAFENDLLVHYFKHAGNPEWDAFVPHLTGTVVPTSPDDFYRLAVNVSDARAFLRGILSRYVAQTPAAGYVALAAEYDEVDKGARMIVHDEAQNLAPYYHDAGMTRPQRPANGKPFVEQFTAQESAALSYIQLTGPERAEFEADQRRADAEPAALPNLLAKWKRRALDAAKAVHAQNGAFADAGARHNFEDIYLRQRLERLDHSYWRLKQDLEQQAFRAAKPSGAPDFGDDDPTAPQRLENAFRLAAFADIGDFAAHGSQARGEGLAAWARQHLKAGADFHALAGPNPHPRPRPSENNNNNDNGNNNNNNTNNNNAGPEDINAAVDTALASYSPIEKAIIKKIATPDELRQIAHGTSTKNWHAAAIDAARHDTDNPAAHPLRDFLGTQGFDDKAFAAYVGCDAILGGPAATGGTLAMDQLQSQFRALSIPGGPSPESIRSQADVSNAVSAVYPGLQKFCQDTVNAGKTQDQQRPGNQVPSLVGGGVTPGGRIDPVPPAPPAGSTKDGGSGKKGDWTDQMLKGTLGGTVGALGGVLAATVLGLGPFGFLAMVVAGAAIGVYMALKKDKPKS